MTGKLKSRSSEPFEITQDYPCGAVEVRHDKYRTFKVNGQQLKLYIEGIVDKHIETSIDLKEPKWWEEQAENLPLSTHNYTTRGEFSLTLLLLHLISLYYFFFLPFTLRTMCHLSDREWILIFSFTIKKKFSSTFVLQFPLHLGINSH